MGATTAIAHEPGSVWRVEFDAGACSLCEMCVNRCPRHALSIRRAGTLEEILFDYRLCDGCAGQAYCEAHCPEKAVIISRVARECMPAEPTILVRGEMTTCQSCGALFVPERKLETLLSKQKIQPKSVQRYCPACRRDHLLESLLSVTGQV